jgi:hypothetical protein
MLEVFTIGGGEYVVNVFNAVAAWSGGGGFRSLLQVVMVMGLAYALLVVAFTLDWRAWLHWFLQATMIYMMLLVPTVTVKVTDRINPGLAPATVANVPLGLGVMASFTSQTGDWMTRTAETVFVMPDALKLSTNGMVYGARLLEKAQTFEITDAEFRANLDEHYKQCVFYDVLLGFKSMNTLIRSTDLWTDIGPGSPARAQRWITRDAGGTSTTSDVITCQDAYTRLGAQINPAVDASAGELARQAYPNLAQAAALAKLKADLPAAADQLHGTTATDAINYLKQVSLVDAFRQARESFSDADWDAYAAQRADAQARNTYTSIAQQAMTWVPLLNIVLTVVFYAMFPVIFPLFLFPGTGVRTLRGYASGFFYLAAWGPLYVVLHMFVMNRAASSMSAVAPVAPTLLVADGIQSVNNDIATIAGFLLMSVPFIAAGMARGALAIAGQATTMLAPAQNAAEGAAVERTTGNYAYGNVSFANSTSNMVQANKWDNTPSFATGYPTSTFTGADGVSTRGFSDGSTAWDSRGGMSFLPDRIDSREGLSWSLSQAIAREQSNQQRISNAEVVSQTNAHSTAHANQSGVSHSAGTESSSGNQASTAAEVFHGHDATIGNRGEIGQDARQGRNSSASRADETRQGSTDQGTKSVDVRLGGGVRAGVGGGSGKGGVVGQALGALGIAADVGLSGGATTDRRWIETDSKQHTNRESTDDYTNTGNHQSAADYSDQRRTGGDRKTASDGTYERDGKFERDDRFNSTTDTNTLTFSSAEEKRQALEASRERSHRLSETLSRVQTGELQITGDISTPIASKYEEYRLSHPDEFLPSVSDPNVSADAHAQRHQKLRELAEEYLRPTIDAHIASAAYENDYTFETTPFPSPSSAPVPRPSASSAGAGSLGSFAGRGEGPAESVTGVRGGQYDGRGDAAHHGMAVKPSAQISQLDPRMAPVIGTVGEEAQRLGINPRTITSGDDSKHENGSRHYDGQGLDFRGHDISVAQGERLAAAVRERLGGGYFVDFEDSRKDPSNNHLHVQTTGHR